MFVKAIEIMDRHPLTFSVDTPIAEAASALLARRIDGACVVRDGVLVGVVTVMDRVFQEKQSPTPGIFTSLLARETMAKMAGDVVGDIMSRDPTAVGPGADLTMMATLMVERHYTILPVVNEGKLVGVVDKWSVLEASTVEGVSDEPTHS